MLGGGGVQGIERERIEVVGCGRTDKGVHASCYVAHFDVPELTAVSSHLNPQGRGGAEMDFIYHANSMLPADIALKRLWPVSDEAHARFDAIEREYTYYVVRAKDPFRAHTAWCYTRPLDVDAMNAAAAHLVGEHDFTSFAKLGSDNKTNICRVTHAGWVEVGTHDLVFTIRADRFLRNMVRAIVGTLVDVGRGRRTTDGPMTPERFGEILLARDLSLSSAGAPARGLFLSGVSY